MRPKQNPQPEDVDPSGEQPLDREHWSFLLRLWRVGDSWRASLQSVQSGEYHVFADLESLLAFLLAHRQYRKQ